MIRRTRPLAALAAFVILAGACGSTTSEPDAQAPATEAPAETAAADGDDAEASSATEAPAETAAPADDGSSAPASSTNPATDTSESAGQPPATDAAADATTAPTDPPAPAWPDDGCSTDGSPTPTDAAEGPAPTLEVRAESGDSLLPAVPVRRINCNGGWVNFQNEIPSPQPLLVWFWAPH